MISGRFAAGTLLGLLALSASPRAGRDLSLEQRVEAQRAIERVYYSHQVGATRGFDEAVPRHLLEKKVRTYLKQSAALEHFWKTPVTGEVLRAELERISKQTQLPDRLTELYAALGNDVFMIQECLARPILVDRLSRSFFASDERVHGRKGDEAEQLGEGRPKPEITWEKWWREVEGAFDERAVPAVATVGGSLPAPVRRAAGPTRWEARLGHSQGSLAVPQAAEGCVEEDGWDDGLRYDVPGARGLHSAIWTGSAMIIWGGRQGEEERPTDTGARYDPVTDTWAPTSVVGAPPASERFEHVVVWAGRVMIVMAPDGQGARYDPISDTWEPVSALNAPEPSRERSAIWTGREMIVWGGVGDSSLLNTGGRYDPDTDRWAPISMADAPSARGSHVAAWTGQEMLVWGGFDSLGPTNSGARYDPATDTWSPMSAAGSPPIKRGSLAVWTGDVMFVWGITSSTTNDAAAGGRYDPQSDTWAPVSTLSAPPGMGTAVWTGEEVILWAGAWSGGARYDPAADLWRPVSRINAPSSGQAVWTGSLMVLWDAAAGGRYDPATDTWTPTSLGRSAEHVPGAGDHVAVWTGSHMVVWGGYDDDHDVFRSSGGRYDPITDSWTPTSQVNAPGFGAFGTWTGDSMVIWLVDDRSWDPPPRGSRYDPLSDTWSPITIPAQLQNERRLSRRAVGAGSLLLVGGERAGENFMYDPATDEWASVSTTGAPDWWYRVSAVWTGQEVIFWRLRSPDYSMSAGKRYNPETDRWAPVSQAGAPILDGDLAVWTGREVVVWGLRRNAAGRFESDGGRYDPSADQWSAMSQDGAPSTGYAAVWAGTEMVVLGGGNYMGGARYDPATDSWAPTTTRNAPPQLGPFTAVWSGNAVLLWGRNRLTSGGRYYPVVRRDDDADGFTACEGDCNEAEAAINPEGVELPGNAIDENCDGAVTCDPGAAWKNRGQLVSCIVRECQASVGAGLLSKETCKALVEAGSGQPSGTRR